MSLSNVDKELTRLKKIAEIFDKLSREILTIGTKPELVGYLSELEELIYNSSEWESREKMKAVNLMLFGCNNSGKKAILRNLLAFSMDDYSPDSSVRLKHLLTLDDKSSELLLIRDDGDNWSKQIILEWTDCALFMFNINDELSLKQAETRHYEFLKISKNIPAILVGVIMPQKSEETKCEPVQRKWSYTNQLNYAKEHNFDKYIEVRPLTGHNVDFMFKYASALVQKHRKLHQPVPAIVEQPTFKVPEKVKGKRPSTAKNESSPAKKLSRRSKRLSRSDSVQSVASPAPEETGARKSPAMSIGSRKSTEAMSKSTSAGDFRQTLASLTRNLSVSKKGSKSKESVAGSSQSKESVAGSSQSIASLAIDCNSLPVQKQGSINLKPTNSPIFTKGKAFVTVTSNGHMFIHKSLKHYTDNKEPKFIDLAKSNVKVPGSNAINGYVTANKKTKVTKKNIADDKIFEMSMFSEGNQVILQFTVDNMTERDAWVKAIQEAIYKIIDSGNIKEQDDNTQTSMEALLEIPSNKYCADCNAEKPNWINWRFGALVCQRCSGGHRALNCKVTSLDLDYGDGFLVMLLTVFGNALVNSIFEGTLDLTDVKRPEPGTNEINDWIKMKYRDKRFMAPMPIKGHSVSKQLMMAISERDYVNQLLIINRATPDQLNESYSDTDQRNPLLIAAQSGQPITVQLLLWAGVDKNVADKKNRNATAYAAILERNDYGMVLEILSKNGVKAQAVKKCKSDDNNPSPPTHATKIPFIFEMRDETDDKNEEAQVAVVVEGTEANDQTDNKENRNRRSMYGASGEKRTLSSSLMANEDSLPDSFHDNVSSRRK